MPGGKRGLLAVWIAVVALWGLLSAAIVGSDEPGVTAGAGSSTTAAVLPTVGTIGPAVSGSAPATAPVSATTALPAATVAAPTTTVPAELTGGVELVEPGTWLLAADGTSGVRIGGGDAGAQLEWASASQLARVDRAASGATVVVVDLDATEHRSALGGGRQVDAAGFAPDRIVFGWHGPTGAGTSSAALDLTGEQILVRGENASTVAVAPGGRSFVVTALGAQTFEPDGQPLSGAVAITGPTMVRWDATGTRVAFTAPNDLEVAAADLTGRQVLVTEGQDTATAFSLEPGGRRIAYHASLAPDQDLAIWVRVAGADDSPAALVASPGREPAWSPDGLRIALTVEPWPEHGRPTGEVRTIAPDGSSPARLAVLAAGLRADHLRWSPDGAFLAVDVTAT